MEFSNTYADFKDYTTPALTPKHIERLDREIWQPLGCTDRTSVLEIGCGTGLVLAYLQAKGVSDFIGIDRDVRLAEVVPAAVRERFRAIDVDAYLDTAAPRSFDRIIMLDVLEHFTVEEGVELLRRLRNILNDDGKILIKVPNAGSPWGLQFQYGDLTHKSAFTPASLRQLALAAGFDCVGCYPHLLGSPNRRRFDRLLHGLLGRLLMTPPEIWSANFFAVLVPAFAKSE